MRDYQAEIDEIDTRIADADRVVSLLSFREAEGQAVKGDLARARAKLEALNVEKDTLTRAKDGQKAWLEDEARIERAKRVKENRQIGREKVARLKVLAKRVDAMAAEFAEIAREIHQIDHEMKGHGIRGEFMHAGRTGQDDLANIARLHFDRALAKSHEQPDRTMLESAIVAWGQVLTLPDEVE